MDGFAPGQIIDGRYRVVDALGEGGMGVVFRARHTDMDRHVAIKLLKSALLPDPDKVSRFMHEARTISRLKHQNIVNVYSVGLTDNGQPYIAMEYIEGKRLSDLISEQGVLTPAEALPLFVQVCEGLAHAHKHEIVHRDIKPSNIMVVSENGVPTAKVVDFGIAKSVAPNVQALTQTGLMMGSAFYMSPGQCLGRAADVRSDVYSLGCTLYEALTGDAPLQGDTIFETLSKQVSEDAPPLRVANPQLEGNDELQAVISCMMQKDAADRYQSMESLKRDLERILEGKPAANIPTAAAPKTEIAKRKPTLNLKFAIPLLTVGALIAVAAFVALNHPKTQLMPQDDMVTIIGRANELEHNDHGPEAISLYNKALEQAVAKNDVRTIAEMQHRIGWNWHKIWTSRGQKKSELETERNAYHWARRSISTLEPVVDKLEENPQKSFADYEAKRSLTLLTIAYDSAARIANSVGDPKETADMLRRLVNRYDSSGQYMIDRDRERAMCVSAIDTLIKRDVAMHEMEQAKECYTAFEHLVDEHFMDPAEAAERMALYKKLLKLH